MTTWIHDSVWLSLSLVCMGTKKWGGVFKCWPPSASNSPRNFDRPIFGMYEFYASPTSGGQDIFSHEPHAPGNRCLNEFCQGGCPIFGLKFEVHLRFSLSGLHLNTNGLNRPFRFSWTRRHWYAIKFLSVIDVHIKGMCTRCLQFTHRLSLVLSQSARISTCVVWGGMY